MIFVFLFALGTIFGSFLNVVALRFNTGLTLGGRSGCPTCGNELKAWELVPVLSFFGLRGRCSRCKTKISWQYPLIELFTGLVFATLYPHFAFSIAAYALALVIFALYIVILIYDLRHMIIPDKLVFPSMVLAIILRYFFIPSTQLDWFAGPLIFTFFALIWALSRGRAMGFGDAKLGLSIGLFLGAPLGFSAIVLAFWIGTVVALALLLRSRLESLSSSTKGLTMKSEIPFAPFLIVGAWVALGCSLDLFHVLTFF